MKKGGKDLTQFSVIKDCAYGLSHVPDLVPYGSIPHWEIKEQGTIVMGLHAHQITDQLGLKQVMETQEIGGLAA